MLLIDLSNSCVRFIIDRSSPKVILLMACIIRHIRVYEEIILVAVILKVVPRSFVLMMVLMSTDAFLLSFMQCLRASLTSVFSLIYYLHEFVCSFTS